MKLQEKKNKIRLELADKGILSKGGHNDYDNYKYFSEAQYKLLFTELFSKNGVEFSMNTINVESFEGTKNMPFGRRVTVEYFLKDTETSEIEVSVVSGEGIDKGDKAIYKAYTGSLKYFFANTFHVATGDDAEKESDKEPIPEKILEHQVKIIKQTYGDQLSKLLENHSLEKLEDMPYYKAVNLIEELRKRSK